MSVEAISYLPPVANITAPALDGSITGQANNALDFPAMFSGMLSQVDKKLQVADGQLQALAVGETQNLHQVMISMEEARLSFQLMVQVRNRLLEGYQEIMRMTV
jgi:flagellar hook-basal body complex protein FliE